MCNRRAYVYQYHHEHGIRLNSGGSGLRRVCAYRARVMMKDLISYTYTDFHGSKNLKRINSTDGRKILTLTNIM